MATGSERSPAGAGRIAWVDVGRGCSILLVVAYHTNIFMSANGLSHEVVQRLSDLFQPVRMPLFFAISGLLGASAITRSWRSVLHDKVALFLYLFAVWSLIHLFLFKYLLPHPSADTAGPFVKLYLYGLVHPQTGIWFIWALAFYFALAKLCRHHRLPVAAATIAVSVLAFHPGAGDHGLNFAQLNALKYAPFFVVPALYGKPFLPRVAENLGWLALAVALCIGVSAVGARVGAAHPFVHGAADFVLNVGGLCAGLIASVWISGFARARTVLSYFGRNTLPIYLIHLLIVSLVVASLPATDQTALRLIGVPVVVAIAVAGSLLAERLIHAAGHQWPFALPVRWARLPVAGQTA